MSEKLCFVIGPIGSVGSPERERADILFKYVIKTVLDDFNINVIRADQISQPGMITQQIINNIKDSDFLIADLHSQNANVFYELALAHALNKNVIQFYTDSGSLPFDVKDLRSIKINVGNIPSYENAKNELKNQVESVLENPEQIQNPFSIAIDLEQLSSSEDSFERTIANVSSQLSEIKNILDFQTRERRLDRSNKYGRGVSQALKVLEGELDVSAKHDIVIFKDKLDMAGNENIYENDSFFLSANLELEKLLGMKWGSRGKELLETTYNEVVERGKSKNWNISRIRQLYFKRIKASVYDRGLFIGIDVKIGGGTVFP